MKNEFNYDLKGIIRALNKGKCKSYIKWFKGVSEWQ